jgi:hypothetical protein
MDTPHRFAGYALAHSSASQDRSVMNKTLAVSILGVIFAVPAHAQRSMANASGPSGNGSISGGTAGSGGPGGGGGSPGTVSFRTLPDVPRATFDAIRVSGSKDEFVPSSWTQFEAGLAEGRAQLAREQKTLGEIAAENREIEKPKAKLMIVEGADGRMTIQRR